MGLEIEAAVGASEIEALVVAQLSFRIFAPMAMSYRFGRHHLEAPSIPIDVTPEEQSLPQGRLRRVIGARPTGLSAESREGIAHPLPHDDHGIDLPPDCTGDTLGMDPDQDQAGP